MIQRELIWRGIQIFLGILNVAVITMFFVAIWRAHEVDRFGLNQLLSFSMIFPTQGLEYKDFIGIVLTAFAVMIAVLTVFLAVSAVWGYSSLKDGAHEMSRKTATTVVREEAIPEAKAEAVRVAMELHTGGALSKFDKLAGEAQRNLTIKSSGKNIEVPVRIFAPVHSDNTYTCTYEIGWPTGVKTMTVSGTDSVQAIEIALQFIGI